MSQVMLPSRGQTSITIDVVAAMVAMLIMTIIAHWVAEAPQEALDTEFKQGVRQGFLNSGASRSLISSLCCLLVYFRVRSWFALCVTGAVLSIASMHVAHALGEGDLGTLAVSLWTCAILAPASWAEYFLTWRIYRKWRTIQDMQINVQ